MKNRFDREDIVRGMRGLISIDRINSLRCIDNKVITLKQLYRDLPIDVFCSFLIWHCDMTVIEKQKFALHFVKMLSNLHRNIHPDDKILNNCVSYIEHCVLVGGDFDRSLISSYIDSICKKKRGREGINASEDIDTYLPVFDLASYVLRGNNNYVRSSIEICGDIYTKISRSMRMDNPFRGLVWDYIKTIK